MGIYYCKRLKPEAYPEPPLSYESLCNALTKWLGEQAYFAHVIYLDDLSTSFINEVIVWRVCAYRSEFSYVELVIKMYPRNEARGLTFRSNVFFKNEITFYEKTLPELLKFQQSRESTTFNNHLKLFLSYCDGKEDSIIFGNELKQGFESPKTKLDIEHVKLVLNTLAKFHALSFAMKDQNPEDFERICKETGETFYSESYWNWYRDLWSQICAVAIDAVEKEYPDTKYVELIKNFAVRSRFKDLISAVKDRTNNVILHGDCTSRNYMFKYEEERPVDVKMLDFQQTRHGSPVLDICSLLYNNSDLLKDEDMLLKYYHEELSSQIRELGSNPDVYNWAVFMSEIMKYSYFGLAVSFHNATTTLNATEITDRVIALGWLSETKIRNIADIHEVKNLENKQRLDLAKNFAHCVDKGCITESLLQSPMFNFW